MRTKSLATSLTVFAAVSAAIVCSAAFSSKPFDGQTPPHAVTVEGKAIPDSSAAQPDKPIIFSKDSQDPKWGELKPEAAFDHSKHNTDVMHTLDGRTLTACVYCHHTEQPMPVASAPYLKKSERAEVLTAKLLEAPNAQAVNSCRHCHFQPSTPKTAEFPPKSVKYPRGSDLPESGELTNDTAYHIKCISCHEKATTRDPNLKAPQGCGDCHVKKSASATPASTLSPTPGSTAIPAPTTTSPSMPTPMSASSSTPTPTAPMTPTPTSTATPTPTTVSPPTPTPTSTATPTPQTKRRNSSRRKPDSA